MAVPTVTVAYDVVSPYSYLGLLALARYRDRGAWNLDLMPVFLGGIMKATGNTPPAFLPARGAYLMRDLARSSARSGVDLVVPPTHPDLTLGAMRLLTACKRDLPNRLEALSVALFERYFGTHDDINAPETWASACAAAEIGHADADTLLAQVADADVKGALKQATENAIEAGAFGAPTIWVDIGGVREMFFGSDRIEALCHALGVAYRGPVPEPA